ncbi:MAG: hypothetical protein QM820_46020 [Minicystis sp.]
MKSNRFLLPGLVMAIVLAAPRLHADTVGACVRAADEGQALRDQGKLLAARERFLACSRDACPRLVRTDCAGWLADVDARIPSVVLAAADAGGRDLTDVTVTIDGAPRSDGTSGRAVPLDPGTHRFRFTRPSGAAVEETVILREGERGRAVTARFGEPRVPPPALPPAPPPEMGRSAIVAAIALGGVAASGAGIFAGLATSAKSNLANLRATCAPNCQQAQVDAVRAKEIGANVALGVGIAAAVAAAVVLIVRPGDAPKPPASAWLGLAPQPGGAFVGAGAAF